MAGPRQVRPKSKGMHGTGEKIENYNKTSQQLSSLDFEEMQQMRMGRTTIFNMLSYMYSCIRL